MSKLIGFAVSGQCENCNGSGDISGVLGQTSENCEWITEMCEPCNGTGETIVSEPNTPPVALPEALREVIEQRIRTLRNDAEEMELSSNVWPYGASSPDDRVVEMYAEAKELETALAQHTAQRAGEANAHESNALKIFRKIARMSPPPVDTVKVPHGYAVDIVNHINTLESQLAAREQDAKRVPVLYQVRHNGLHVSTELVSRHGSVELARAMAYAVAKSEPGRTCEVLVAYIDAALATDEREHVHQWTDMRNSVIESGEMCSVSGCGAIRAGNQTTAERGDGTNG